MSRDCHDIDNAEINLEKKQIINILRDQRPGPISEQETTRPLTAILINLTFLPV